MNNSTSNSRISIDPELRKAMTSRNGVPSPASIRWFKDAMRARVIHGPGVLIITGFGGLSQDALGAACLGLSRLAGTVVPQDRTGTILREVRDRGTSVGEGLSARYADSRFGGDLHTDGAESPAPVPDYFALMCVRQAPIGGDLRIVNIDDVMAVMPADSSAVRVLRESFEFDRRGDNLPSESPTTLKPVLFDHHAGHVGVTYLRRYIEVGHSHPGVPPLTPVQIDALDVFDKAIASSEIGSIERLEPGEFALFNNTRVLHGRTTFEDDPDPSLGRLLYRTWIHGRYE